VADKKSKLQGVDSGAEGAEQGPSLGQLITEARERKGLTRDQVTVEAHLPEHYVKMIETDNYDLISDRLYLVPFLRRYATYLGLDAEEIASRFVSSVQHAEANVVRISQEITVVAKKPGAATRVAFALLIAAVIVLLADFAWRRFVERDTSNPVPVASPAALAPAAMAPKAEAPNEALPPATIVTNPEAMAPAAAPPRNGVATGASTAPGSAGVPPAATRSVRPQPLPRADTDD
jgi:cytoskeleton protein RodZ